MIDADPSIHVASVIDGELLIDGEPMTDHPFRRGLAGHVAYYPQGTDTAVIEGYMEPRDTAYRGGQRSAESITFRDRAERSTFRVMPAETWGIQTDDPTRVAGALEHLHGAVTAEGWEWTDTVSGLAGRICRKHVEGLRQLPPRWRTLAHAAIHQGPTVCLRGGAPSAESFDRKSAFLQAMYLPLPAIEGWACHRSPRWSTLAKLDGLIRATVQIPPEAYAGQLPPLPCRRDGATVYPVGTIRGVWTIAMLRDAVEAGGVEIVTIHEAITCPLEPIHAWAADRVAAVADPLLRKRLYTRYWGRLASVGGWEGRTSSLLLGDLPAAGVHRFRGSSLWWAWRGRELTSHTAPPDYRPDHAAFIASANHLAMNRAIRTIQAAGADRLIGVHVDAIWIEGAGNAPPAPDFRLKAQGETRFYGVGTYRTGGKLAAQGYKGPPLTPDTLDEWGRGLDPGQGLVRSWLYGQGPNASPDALSDPPEWSPDRLPAHPRPGVPVVTWERWTRKGWYFDPDKPPDTPEASA